MKTQDIGFILQKLQSEKKKIEKLTAVLHSLDGQPFNRHVYHATDRKTVASYRQLEARKKIVNDLENIYMDMVLQKELQFGSEHQGQSDRKLFLVSLWQKELKKYWTMEKRVPLPVV
ncbi:probable U3 small nucleolar RNA-associated protein 11 isoform X2 [Tripterygium wilfordii]|uniref:probable U3 small nucleolar RNA-associated protein 11 isoform X2 n=1 Tax=Tripterygium wilfordii TaxID=458696 RepID=UPI0018F8371E|nr:probable U3 small nucleolar RNA-associated protein 11 isoform X2 [Tripterygium wilfordii]